jgi:hypothetical protein
MMIEPTVGRVVWFYTYVEGQGHKGPLAAHIAAVHSSGSTAEVNLMVISSTGDPRSEKNVILLQDDEARPGCDFCTWMPYQKAVAAGVGETKPAKKERKGKL